MQSSWPRAFAFGLVLSLAGGATAAVDPAFDFTGHWVGYGQEEGVPQDVLTADLTQETGTRKFSGTVAVQDDPPFTCTVAGKQKPHKMKVLIHLTCGNGGKLTLHGTLDAAANTVTGGYTRHGRHKVHKGTFSLAEQPA